jgi:hypothetical protein
MMITGKTFLLAAVLAAAPFATTAANAQMQRNTMTTQSRDRATTTDRTTMDRSRMDQRDVRDRDNRDVRDRDRDRDRRDMRHFGWRRGHHYGWRNCMMRWHHHHRVRICR